MFADPGIEHDYVYADFLFVINLLRANVALVRYLFEILQFFFSQFTLTYAICNIVIAKWSLKDLISILLILEFYQVKSKLYIFNFQIRKVLIV